MTFVIKFEFVLKTSEIWTCEEEGKGIGIHLLRLDKIYPDDIIRCFICVPCIGQERAPVG